MASGPCVPHQQAAHMAAPTKGQSIKNTLANGEPSTHGAKRTFGWLGMNARSRPKADIQMGINSHLVLELETVASQYDRHGLRSILTPDRIAIHSDPTSCFFQNNSTI